MDISIFSGDSKEITITVSDEGGSLIDLTGASVAWAIAQQNNVIVSKSTAAGGIALGSDPTKGQFIVTLKGTDTAQLSGQYTQFARVTLASGDTAVVITGNLTVIKSPI